jgi:hypothetical protein
MTDLMWEAYRKQIAFVYGDVGEALVAAVDSGELTPSRAFEIIAKAEADGPCPECGRSG